MAFFISLGLFIVALIKRDAMIFVASGVFTIADAIYGLKEDNDGER